MLNSGVPILIIGELTACATAGDRGNKGGLSFECKGLTAPVRGSLVDAVPLFILRCGGVSTSAP